MVFNSKMSGMQCLDELLMLLESMLSFLLCSGLFILFAVYFGNDIITLVT